MEFSCSHDLAAVIVSPITPRALDTDAEHHQRLVTTKLVLVSAADLEVMDLCDDSARLPNTAWLQYV